MGRPALAVHGIPGRKVRIAVRPGYWGEEFSRAGTRDATFFLKADKGAISFVIVM